MHNIGKVYVYRRTEGGWVYSTSILAPDVTRQAHFGREITYHNGYVAIHEFASISSDDKGQVHLYHFQNSRWTHLATLTPSTPQNSDNFGRSIAMNDSVIVVGTGGIETSSRDSTAVYVFLKDGEWKDATEDAKLISTDKHRSDRFGFDVDLSGDSVIAGAPWFSTTVTSSENFLGKAYLFKRPASGWSGVINETAQLTPSDPKQDHFFGYSVTIDPHNIKIGAPHYILNWNSVSSENNADINVEAGKVYVYFKPSTGWATTTEGIQLTSPEPEPLDVFGETIESGNGHFFVGSFLDDNEAGKQAGSVHAYDDLPYIVNSSTTVCPGDNNIQLTAFPTGGEWVGQGVDANTGTFNPSLAGPGTHIISYRIGICLNLPFITIKVPEILQPIDIDATELYICQHQDSVQVNHNYSSDASLVHWSYSQDGVNFTGINSTNNGTDFYAKQAGLYRAIVTNPCYTFSDAIQINEQVIEVPPDFSICADEKSITLQNYSPVDGLWSGTGIASDGSIDLTTPEKGLHYYHYEVNRINCVFKDSVLVDLHSIPAIAFTQDQTEYSICATDQVEISLSELDPLWKTEWEYSQGNASYFLIDDQQLGTLKAQNQGFYRAIVSDDFCEVVSDIVEIKHIGESRVLVPNVFTPNGDGINDTFQFEYENISIETLHIYNRLGKVVFKSNDLQKEWNGLNQPAGVYFYNLSYYATCDPVNKFELQGIIHILK